MLGIRYLLLGAGIGGAWSGRERRGYAQRSLRCRRMSRLWSLPGFASPEEGNRGSQPPDPQAVRKAADPLLSLLFMA